MKFFILCLVVFPFCISCTDVSDLSTVSGTANPNDYLFTSKLGETSPANPLNPYDIAGQLHTELYTAYYEEDSLAVELSAILDRVLVVSAQNETFVSLSTSSYSIDSTTLSSLIGKISCCSVEVIENSLATDEAALSLQSFISTLVPLCDEEDDYNIIYSFITSYENTVLGSKNIPASDKQVILITTSIIRYSTYERKKRPKKNTDPEWDLMIGNIIGSVDGASEGIEAAVLKSLLCGIVENGE
ncbi:hypothetical protein [uncultured Flavobacterium sp.]|uniref:hypothetical protein n=1 Tax=uncultured Flavobacterium sp. TaxID=165435 RepID=UPI0030C7AC84